MTATCPIALWPGLIATLWLAGSDSPAAGPVEEGASGTPPLFLGAPELLVPADRGVEVAGQILWTDPDRIHLLGLMPECILAVEPRSGILERLARSGPGPFELDGPVALLSAGATARELLVHQPGHSRTIVFPRGSAPFQIRHGSAVTGCVVDEDAAWWMGPRLWDPHAGVPARVEVWRGPPPGAAQPRMRSRALWHADHRGSPEEVVLAQYFTRLLKAPAGQLWRVVLGARPRIDLIDPGQGTARTLAIDPAEGAGIEASVDRSGVLYLLTAGGEGTFGRRILRFAPERLDVLVGDRDWNTGAVDPDGSAWAATEADLGDLLVYRIPATTGPNSP